MSQPELKSCPFCGGEASDAGHQQWSRPVPNTTWDDGSFIYESFSVNCVRCGISTLGSLGVGHRTKEAAVAAWNTRPADPRLAAAGETEKALQAAELFEAKLILEWADFWDVAPQALIDALMGAQAKRNAALAKYAEASR
jgi:hypothetical protein